MRKSVVEKNCIKFSGCDFVVVLDETRKNTPIKLLQLTDSVEYAGIFDVKRVDTTSAGDSFIGGFCSALCDGNGIADSVYYASAVSSITIGRSGASVSIPTADEVKEFLKTNRIKERD